MPALQFTVLNNLTMDLPEEDVYQKLNHVRQSDPNFTLATTDDDGNSMMVVAINKKLRFAVKWLFDEKVHGLDVLNNWRPKKNNRGPLDEAVCFKYIENESEEKIAESSDLAAQLDILNLVLQNLKKAQEMQEKQQQTQAMLSKTKKANFFQRKKAVSSTSVPTPTFPIIQSAQHPFTYLEALRWNNQKFLEYKQYSKDYVIHTISKAYADTSDVNLTQEAYKNFVKEPKLNKYSIPFLDAMLKGSISQDNAFIARHYPDLFSAMAVYSIQEKNIYSLSLTLLQAYTRLAVIEQGGYETVATLGFDFDGVTPKSWEEKITSIRVRARDLYTDLRTNIAYSLAGVSYFDEFNQVAHRNEYGEAFIKKLDTLEEKNIDQLFVFPVKRIQKDAEGNITSIDTNSTSDLLSSSYPLMTETLKKLITYLVNTPKTLYAFTKFFSRQKHIELFGSLAIDLLLDKMGNLTWDTEIKMKWGCLENKNIALTLDQAWIIFRFGQSKYTDFIYRELSTDIKNQAYDAIIKERNIVEKEYLNACLNYERSFGRPVTTLLADPKLFKAVGKLIFAKPSSVMADFLMLPSETQQTIIKQYIMALPNAPAYLPNDSVAFYLLLPKISIDEKIDVGLKKGLIKVGQFLLDFYIKITEKLASDPQPAEVKTSSESQKFQDFLTRLDDVSKAEIITIRLSYPLDEVKNPILTLLFMLLQKNNLLQNKVIQDGLALLATEILEKGRFDLSAIWNMIGINCAKTILATYLEKNVGKQFDASSVKNIMQDLRIHGYAELFSEYTGTQLDALIDKCITKAKETSFSSAWVDITLALVDKTHTKLKTFHREPLQKILMKIRPTGNIEQFKLFIKNCPSEISKLDNVHAKTKMEKGYDEDGNRRIECLLAAIHMIETSHDDKIKLDYLTKTDVEDRKALRAYFVGTRHENFIRENFGETNGECPAVPPSLLLPASVPHEDDDEPGEIKIEQPEGVPNTTYRRLSLFGRSQSNNPSVTALLNILADTWQVPGPVQTNSEAIRILRETLGALEASEKQDTLLKSKRQMTYPTTSGHR